jgi:hypothetical protein
MDLLEWLQNWYHQHCDGGWEHSYGIRLTSLDNPGWGVTINLEDTNLEFATFDDLIINRSEIDWVDCKVQKKVFRAYGGPNNLKEIIEIFRRWAMSQHGPGNSLPVCK